MVPPLPRPSRPATPRDRLIFALDVDTLDEALRLVERLGPHVGLFKVGPRLCLGGGAAVLEALHAEGAGVFLDLKFHDIPATVAGAALEVARQRAALFTVHALGGARMIAEVARALSQPTQEQGHPPPVCLAVTVLTSHAEDELRALGLAEPLPTLVSRLARSAVEAGAGGVVASGREVAALRRELPAGTLLVTPGIRGAGEPAHDQTRVMSAREAIEAGATHVVVGRPIRDARDPVDAARRIVDDIARAIP